MGDLEDILGEDDGLESSFGPELGKIKLGRMLKAAATGGLSEVARSRIGRAALTGGVSEVARSRLGRAALTGGMSEVARAGKKLLKGKGKVSAKGSVSAKASGKAKSKSPATKNGSSDALLARSKAPSGGKAFPAALPPIHIHISPVSTQVAAKLSPEMAKISGLLQRMQLQTQATSEHNKLHKQAKFRKGVLKALKHLEQKRGCTT